MGIVRRKKVDVAADIPARRIADIPVELDDEDRLARSARPRRRWPRASWSATRPRSRPRRPGSVADGIDHEIVRRVARELEESKGPTTGDNVFTMVPQDRPGQGRPRGRLHRPAGAQRRQGRVLRQAHRRDGRRRGALRQAAASRRCRSAATRPPKARQQRDRRVRQRSGCRGRRLLARPRPASASTCRPRRTSCSPSSSWTNAEQTQAIDRVHRIGQERPGHRVAHHRRAARSTPGSRSSSTRRPASRRARSTARTRRSRPRPTSRPRPWSRCSPTHWSASSADGHHRPLSARVGSGRSVGMS